MLVYQRVVPGSKEAQNLQEIMPHEWDPIFSPVPLLRKQLDPDGATAADEQADVEDEGTTEATATGFWKRNHI